MTHTRIALSEGLSKEINTMELFLMLLEVRLERV